MVGSPPPPLTPPMLLLPLLVLVLVEELATARARRPFGGRTAAAAAAPASSSGVECLLWSAAREVDAAPAATACFLRLSRWSSSRCTVFSDCWRAREALTRALQAL